jgi:hypothetical protein
VWLEDIAAGLSAALPARERTAADLSLLRYPTFHASVWVVFSFAWGLVPPLLLPLMLQLGFGYSPSIWLADLLHSGGAIFMKTIVSRVLERFGFKQVLSWNAVLVAISMAVYGLFRPDTPHWVMLLVFVLGGFLRSLQFTSLNAIAFADVGQAENEPCNQLVQRGAAIGRRFWCYFCRHHCRLVAGSKSIVLQSSDFAWSFLAMGC